MKAILNRLKEPSTWAAFGGIALSLGVSSEDWVQQSALGVAVAAFVLGILTPEKGDVK